MPRPPIHELPNWRRIFSSGKTYVEWVRGAEFQEKAVEIERLRENQQIPPEMSKILRGLAREVHIVAFAEDWCGDVVKFVPVLQRLAESAERITIRYHSRENANGIFERYLTNGGESIPKFIFLNDVFVECGNWGPMPSECKVLIARGKACNNLSRAREKVAARLGADPKNLIVLSELIDLVQIASATEP